MVDLTCGGWCNSNITHTLFAKKKAGQPLPPLS